MLWQHEAASRVDQRFRIEDLFARLTDSGQALVRSQGGPGAGLALSTCPTCRITGMLLLCCCVVVLCLLSFCVCCVVLCCVVVVVVVVVVLLLCGSVLLWLWVWTPLDRPPDRPPLDRPPPNRPKFRSFSSLSSPICALFVSLWGSSR